MPRTFLEVLHVMFVGLFPHLQSFDKRTSRAFRLGNTCFSKVAGNETPRRNWRRIAFKPYSGLVSEASNWDGTGAAGCP